MEDFLKYILTPLIAGLSGYFFAVRGKKKEIDIQKERELNVILSHMLNTWYYLNRLDCLLKAQEEQNNVMIIPREFLPIIIFKSGLLDDTCFLELEKSINTLRQYDAVTYFELEGIGKRLDFLKSNYVVPFLKGNNTTNISGQIVSRSFLDMLLKDIKRYIYITAELLSKETLFRARNKIDKTVDGDFKALNDEINLEVYNIYMTIVPASMEKPTFEQFIAEMKNEANQKLLSNQLSLMMSNDLNEILSNLASNPEISIQELHDRIKN
jgi:hypothetical protein